MPYFKWSGIDIYGRSRKGKFFCGSQKELDALLLSRDIALISSKNIRPLFEPAIHLADKVQFFTQLTTLLKTGMHLPQALATLSAQITHVRLSAVIHEYAHRVQEGEPLADALRSDSFGHDPVINAMMHIGQETGALDTAVQALSSYLEFKNELFKKIRSALRLPLITFVFFLVVMVVLFTFVIPIFASLFVVAQKEVPAITRYMLATSDLFKTHFFWGALISFLMLMYLCWGAVSKKSSIKKWYDACILRLPFVGTLVYCSAYAHFFKALSLLLKNGVPNAKALFYAIEVIDNHYLYQHCLTLAHEVRAGIPLSHACARMHYIHASFDVLSLISTGQESGTMGTMIDRVADLYHEKCALRLAWLALLVQPILMIVMGFFVALLICAVYLPLLNVSCTW